LPVRAKTVDALAPLSVCLLRSAQMPATFEDAFARVKQLAADFKANEKFYLSQQYQEAEARRDFIDKFLIALGWDVNHETQKNPYEQEVKVERKEHGVSQRRADYAFYLAPNFRDVKFYIEAKKPFGDIATPDNYFQTIRYGWNSKTPIAALFDFEQFETVDCRFKPDLETALQRNLKKFKYSQYSDKEVFAEIYWLFSREAVANGSLEKYAEALPKKRGAAKRGLLKGSYQSIDDSFLEELDAHRDTLAHIFKNNNPKLDGETLTEVTQRTLDRLVFIRFLEDKQIEPQHLVSKFGERGSVWGDFIATSRRLDGIYNGIVFKKNEVLDSPNFKVDDDQFGEICEALCHVNSPYDFNAIPIHILGSIYERFLGKVIVATDKRARVEEKPEVRKAGGVYYTPEYIVRYIVENTVGKLIEGKTPAKIAEMKFADIACGSGSFLLGVYDLLIRYHTKFYNENPRKAKKGDVMQREDGLHLSLRKKREILVNNLYGVDIDNQAVEVAQLSLYLKLLQDETPGSTRQYFLDFEQQALLPSLNKNIVCGNSLIGTDILSGELFEPVAERKLNPMNFEDRFPEIMKCGGFDAIVGNPPWGVEFSEKELDYLRTNFKTAEASNVDSYAAFIEAATTILRESGLLGYIVPDTFLRKDDYLPTRRFFLERTRVHELIETGPVFSQVRDTWCLVFSVEKNKPSKATVIRHKKISRYIVSVEERLKKFGLGSWDFISEVPQSLWLARPNLIVGYLAEKSAQALVAKIENNPRLGQLSNRFRISRGEEGSKFNLTEKTNGDFFMVTPENVERYEVAAGLRVGGRSLTPGKAEAYYTHPKIWIIRIQKMRWKQRIVCGFDSRKNSGAMKTLQVVVSTNDDERDLKYLQALLASRLTNFWCINYLADDMNQSYLEKIPIRQIDFSKLADKAQHDKMVSLVEQMLAAKKQLAGAQSDKDKDFYGNKCAALDRQIDALVYELYCLTADEIKIVEQATT
jgi:hypothetical protein